MEHIRTFINYRTLVMLFAVAFALLAVLFFDSVSVHLFAVWAVAFIACWLVRFDLIHPYCWFSLTFCLYNTSYTILYAMGYDTYAGYSYHNTVYTLIALAVVLTVVGGEKVEDELQDNITVINTKYNDLLFYLFAILAVVFAFILLRRGYSGKIAMKEANDVFYSLGVHVVRWMLVIMLIQMCYNKCVDNKKVIGYVLVSMIASVTLGLLTGERDMFIRTILVLLFVLFYFKKIKKKHLFIFVPIGVVIMILSVNFKYYFLRGEMNTNHMEGNFLYQFLMSDFRATGRNTQFLINNDWTKGYYGLKILFNELIRGLVPFVNTFNPSTWYNNDVYPGTFKGQAFTYVGFGYVIGGIFGIILVCILLGAFIRYTYRHHTKSLYSLVFYLYSISIVSGCYRGTINTIIGTSLKGALIAILMSIFLSRFANKKRLVK